ncbi:MAG: phosphate acyltransferase PlsX [Spirochaetia bacterium]|nr:phosphate acyltransferase PlsX [Spirochaetia bacterium]
MKVAVDAMGGDHGVNPVIIGSVLAARELKAKVILVGDGELLEKELAPYRDVKNSIEIEHADEVVSMNESPVKAVRSKKNSSIVISTRLVKEARAVGFFSPGNTGATMAAALSILGRLDGVKRPAIAVPIPKEDGTVSLLLDAGANVDCKTEYLTQFAVMGEIYSREILSVLSPKIGILSNGEEDSKGNESTQALFKRLKKLPFHFAGNIEGRDLFGMGKLVDVIVCDGFTGNITLKTIEGCAKSIFNILRENIKKSSLAKTGALLLKPAFSAVKHTMDYSSYGGAPLLGVDGIVMIGHGSSGAQAVKNGIRVTLEFARHKINKKISDNIKRLL